MRERSARTLRAYWELASSKAPAYICSAVSVSPNRREGLSEIFSIGGALAPPADPLDPQRMRYSIWERAPTPSQVLGREPLSSADRAHLMEICKTLEDFVDTILFQGSHA